MGFSGLGGSDASFAYLKGVCVDTLSIISPLKDEVFGRIRAAVKSINDNHAVSKLF